MSASKLGKRRCQCAACGEYFNGVSVFEAHRVGKYGALDGPTKRRCLSVAEMEARDWLRNAAFFWVADSNPHRSAKGSARAFLGDFGLSAGVGQGSEPNDLNAPFPSVRFRAGAP